MVLGFEQVCTKIFFVTQATPNSSKNIKSGLHHKIKGIVKNLVLDREDWLTKNRNLLSTLRHCLKCVSDIVEKLKIPDLLWIPHILYYLFYIISLESILSNDAR